MDGALKIIPRLKPVNTKRTTVEREEDNMEGVVEQPLSPWSRMLHQPEFNVHILAIMGSKTPINVDKIKEMLPHTLLKHPRFSSITMGGPNGKDLKWVRITKVDLNYHVIVPPIDPTIIPPGSKTADKYVENYIYNLTKTKLDKSRPLWDLHLLKLKTSKEEGIGIFRIHHSLGDGISLMSLLLACTRKVSDPTSLPTIPKRKKKMEKDTMVYDWRCCWKVLVLLWRILEVAWITFVDVVLFLVTLFFLKDTDTCIKGKHGVEFAPKRVVYKTVSLNDMKLVKNATNATVNDVAIGMTQAGLSRYLSEKYSDCETENGAKNKLPKKIRLRSAIMVNTRPAPGIQELAHMMEKNTDAEWGNGVGYVLLPFSIGTKNDPLDHVQEAKAIIDQKKRSFEAIVTFLLVKLLSNLFGNKVACAIAQRAFRNTTLTFSNMVGPTEEICFYGHQLNFIAPTAYGLPQGAIIHFISYNDEMTIVLSADEDTIPDANQLAEDIVESLKLMKESTLMKLDIEKGAALSAVWLRAIKN